MAMLDEFASGQQRTRPAETVKIVIFTPDIARQLLEHNTHNRRPNMGVVRRYCNEMTNGQWLFCGDTIRCDWNGTLLDGQQRLMAIVATGLSQRFVLVEGLDPDAMWVIDRGRKRTSVTRWRLRAFSTPRRSRRSRRCGTSTFTTFG
jgi:hypothetical protein